jgi:hypothetical protein
MLSSWLAAAVVLVSGAFVRAFGVKNSLRSRQSTAQERRGTLR